MKPVDSIEKIIEDIKNGYHKLADCKEGSYPQADWLMSLDVMADKLSQLISQQREEAVRGFYKYLTKPIVDEYLNQIDPDETTEERSKDEHI